MTGCDGMNSQSVNVIIKKKGGRSWWGGGGVGGRGGQSISMSDFCIAGLDSPSCLLDHLPFLLFPRGEYMK